MTDVQKIIGTGVLYLLAIVLGVWLSRSGRPFSAALSAIHKLVSLGAVAVSVLLFIGLLKGREITAANWALIVASGAFVVALIATGAVLSGAKEVIRPLLLVHNLSTALALLCLAGAVYFAVK